MVYDGIFVEQVLVQNCYEFVIFDFGLLGIDGMMLFMCFCQINCYMFVIVLIVCDELNDWIQGLNFGVDDYMFKLFELVEFEVCICVVMCCSGLYSDMLCLEVLFGGVCLLGVDCCIFNDDKLFELLLCEFVVFEMLLLCYGCVVSKVQLQDYFMYFGGDFGDIVIEVYVYCVCKKFEQCWVEIVIVCGFGYLLQEICQMVSV